MEDKNNSFNDFSDDVGYLEFFGFEKPSSSEELLEGEQEVHEWFLEGCKIRFTLDDLPL